MCMMNARLSVCVKIVKSGSCEGRRRRPEHKIYRVLHSYYRHHLNFLKRPYLFINTLIYNEFTAFQSIVVRNHPVESDTECVSDYVYVSVRSWIPIHMPLNDMQIRRAKAEAKAYTLRDGQGL